MTMERADAAPDHDLALADDHLELALGEFVEVEYDDTTTTNTTDDDPPDDGERVTLERGIAGEDVHQDVWITLDRAFQGTQVTVTVRTVEVCVTCHDSDEDHGLCDECVDCGRGGLVPRVRWYRVTIPRRVADGARLVVRGAGGRGLGGGRDGDLHLTVRVHAHGAYKREGNDLAVQLPITLSEAVGGGLVSLCLPDGARLYTRLPPGCQSGQRLLLRGFGLGHGPERGNLYADLLVRLPTRADARIQRLAAELDRLYQDEVRSPARPWGAEPSVAAPHPALPAPAPAGLPAHAAPAHAPAPARRKPRAPRGLPLLDDLRQLLAGRVPRTT